MGIEKKLKVLSLFDGMSGTQIALKYLGIEVDTYYASEVDKYAIQITQKNFPNTIQLGDIKDIKGADLPEIDLIVAGSPCQGFSFAGKQLAFDDPRSALFFEFVRVLREVKPKYFLLENVRMKKEYIAVITQQVSKVYPEYTSGGLFGIEPILINSALVSAQNRNRYYWTNIPGVKHPKDLGIVLRDILEESSDSYGERYSTPKQVGVAADINGHDILKRVYSEDGKSPTVNSMGGGNREPKVAVKGGAIRGRAYDDKGKRMDKDGVSVANKTTQMLELRKDDKSNAITTVGKDSLVVSKGLEFSHGLESGRRLEDGKNLSRNYSEGSRVYKTSGKAATLTASSKGRKGGYSGLYGDELHWRKLTPLECERLQTVPDNYTEGVSNTQRYKMLGNGFTVRVIEHILKNIK